MSTSSLDAAFQYCGCPWVFRALFNCPLHCAQDSSENSSAPTTQFIMLPLPAYSVVENPSSIKLVSSGELGL